jgi:natural product precursor
MSKLKLNQFSKDELDQRKMNALKGGCECKCGCSCSCCAIGFSTSASSNEDVTGPNLSGSISCY